MVKKIKCKDFIPAQDNLNVCFYARACEVGRKYCPTGCKGEFIIPEFISLDCPIARFLKIDGMKVDKGKCDYLISYNDFQPSCTHSCNPRKR